MISIPSIDPSFWAGKRVFLTGHTGFKGSWASLWLLHLGATPKGYALEPEGPISLFEELNLSDLMETEVGDIRNSDKLRKSILEFKPDILLHMAAQPLVRLSYQDPVGTYSTNVMGTINVFEAARRSSTLRALVNVTTDKCYENREWVWGYRENEAMGGYDPYSNSKGCAELVTSAYRSSFFNSPDTLSLGSARAGNVIGGGDWAADRLIPDIVRALEANQNITIRNPNAIRPWQHVLEPLSGYLILAQNLFTYGDSFAEAWNFGPRDEDAKPVQWIASYLIEKWGSKIDLEFQTSEQPHEAQLLKLDISKASSQLGWNPKLSLSKALDSIVTWNKSRISGANVRELTLEQIKTLQFS